MKKFLVILLMLFSSALVICYLFSYIKENKVTLLSPEEELLIKKAALNIEFRSLKEDVAEQPQQVVLGRDLFYDKGLSKDKNVSCATCHVAGHNFQDVNNISRKVNSPSPRALGLRGVAQQSWYFWDGRADSLWAQVLEALTTDHGLIDSEIVDYVCGTYVNNFPSTLNHCDETRYSAEQLIEIGQVIASYVSTIDHYWTRFDEYVYHLLISGDQAKGILSEDEISGMRLFFDSQKTGCADCHSGPRFSNGGFYAIGTGRGAKNDRIFGAKRYKQSPYQCELWASSEKCVDSVYARLEGSDLKGAFKVPSLRNLKYLTSFMHDGRFESIEEVLDFYINPYSFPLAHTDVTPVRILPHQRKQLVLFLQALNEEYLPTYNDK